MDTAWAGAGVLPARAHPGRLWVSPLVAGGEPGGVHVQRVRWWRRGTARAPADVVIVGDSLSAGEFASARHLTCSALILRKLVQWSTLAQPRQVVAVPGARAADLLRRALPEARRVAVVEVGTNDWLGYRPTPPWRETPIAEFRDTYARLLRRVAGNNRPELICLGIWSPPESGGSSARQRRGAYEEAIALEAARLDGCFVPLRRIAEDPSARGPAGRPTPFGTSDETHPNDRGHALIAAAVLAALRRGA